MSGHENDDDHGYHKYRSGSEEARAGTLQIWRIVAKEAGLRGEHEQYQSMMHFQLLSDQACLPVLCLELPGYLLEGRCSLEFMRRSLSIRNSHYPMANLLFADLIYFHSPVRSNPYWSLSDRLHHPPRALPQQAVFTG